MSTPSKDEIRLFLTPVGQQVLIRITQVYNNDLARYFRGECILTGVSYVGGLYTDEQFAAIGEPLNEMEVLAWAARYT